MLKPSLLPRTGHVLHCVPGRAEEMHVVIYELYRHLVPFPLRCPSRLLCIQSSHIAIIANGSAQAGKLKCELKLSRSL